VCPQCSGQYSDLEQHIEAWNKIMVLQLLPPLTSSNQSEAWKLMQELIFVF
jgi:hypothetical protein